MRDILVTMAEGNPGAAKTMMQMLNRSLEGFLDILLLDTLEIRGSKIYMLLNDCCGRDFDKLDRTLMMLRAGTFTQEQIHGNLELPYAIPFIDDDVIVDGVPAYNKKFGPTDTKWDEYCNAQKIVFVSKLQEQIDRQNEYKKGSK
jgi:hypothetical protein